MEGLLSEKSTLDKKIKKAEKALKEQAEERILTLTDTEIDYIVYKKWFGDVIEKMVNLIETPLKKELESLNDLQERYADTLATIEAEGNALEEQFKAMLQELVVTE